MSKPSFEFSSLSIFRLEDALREKKKKISKRNKKNAYLGRGEFAFVSEPSFEFLPKVFRLEDALREKTRKYRREYSDLDYNLWKMQRKQENAEKQN